MKHFRLILLIYLLLSVSTSCFSQGTFNGNIVFTNQTQIDTFPPYTKINGRVAIRGTGITNLDSLYRLTEIRNNLDMTFPNSISQLEGLRNLRVIGGSLDMAIKGSFFPNYSLKNLDGFRNLDSIGLSLRINKYDSLRNIDGLSNLKWVRSDIALEKNARIKNLDALANIDSIRNLILTENSLLENIDGLTKITYLTGGIEIGQNQQLKDLNGLSNLTFCGGFLVIYDNDSLRNLAPLSSLTSIGNFSANSLIDLNISENDMLTSLRGLENVQNIYGKIRIRNNLSLVQIDAFTSMDSLHESLEISLNPSLQNLQGLRNIIYYGGSINITANTALTDCCGLYRYVSNVDSLTAANIFNANAAGCNEIEVLNNGPCGGYTITGNSYLDVDGNCLEDPQDFPLTNRIVVAEPGPYYALTDSNGNYQMSLDSGNYLLSILDSEDDWELCDSSIQVNNSNTTAQTLGLKASPCPDLTLSLGGFWSRRCFPGRININYCNLGLISATQTQLWVDLPPNLKLLSADMPFVYEPDSSLLFDLATLAPNTCGNISLDVQETCSSVELLGLSPCVEAWISSPDNCTPVAANWSGASLSMDRDCINDTVKFSVVNHGAANMQDSTSYRIFADTVLVDTGKLFLNMGDSLVFDIAGNGQTFRLEVDQVPNHPTNTMVSVALEACTATLDSSTSKGMIQQFSTPLRRPESGFAVNCQEIIGSYDPNDKQVFPQGIGPLGLTPLGSQLEYLIRFQNTGTDTAFTVEIRDELSSALDLSTFRLGSASHPFRMELKGFGKAVLHFYFDNIQLPDSNVNPAASQGYIQFFIDALPEKPAATEIKNWADIYFDFNPPIRTNTVLNTLSDFRPENLGSIPGIVKTYYPNSINQIEDSFHSNFSFFPNPVKNHLFLSVNSLSMRELNLEWINLQGKRLFSESVKMSSGSSQIQLKLPHLKPGLYFIQINKTYTYKLRIE